MHLIPPWWRHQMDTFSALLTICAGNSPVTGEFPAQRPVTRSFGVFFDLHLHKWLSKQSWGWWFYTPSHPLWRHCNDYTTCQSNSNCRYGRRIPTVVFLIMASASLIALAFIPQSGEHTESVLFMAQQSISHWEKTLLVLHLRWLAETLLSHILVWKLARGWDCLVVLHMTRIMHTIRVSAVVCCEI